MNTPFGNNKDVLDGYVPEHLRDGTKEYTTEKHDLQEIIDREDVHEARKMMNKLIEGETAEAAVLIACEILARHATNKGSDFTAVSAVNPARVGGRKGVAFEISTVMTVDGKA